MAEGTMSLADIAAIGSGGMGHLGGGWMGAGLGLIGGLIFASIFGGNGGFWGNRGGYGTQYATSNEVQRGFDNQNSMANQREILTAVNTAASQGIAATNQVFHDLVGYVGDKYNELDRDVLGVSAAVQQSIANQNECCCNTRMAIADATAATNANIAQSRYDAALATANTNAAIAAGFADLKQTMAQDKIESLNNRIQQLELAQATSSVVRYPTTTAYTSGCNPFCNCNNGCGYGF